ncbi:hypothetical protein AURDEDRAFT_110329, partial [Auricularia subglabra TFB-10046 SS5]
MLSWNAVGSERTVSLVNQAPCDGSFTTWFRYELARMLVPTYTVLRRYRGPYLEHQIPLSTDYACHCCSRSAVAGRGTVPQDDGYSWLFVPAAMGT